MGVAAGLLFGKLDGVLGTVALVVKLEFAELLRKQAEVSEPALPSCAEGSRIKSCSAVYATPDETPFLHRTMAEYFPIVAARQSGASRNEARHDQIEAIDIGTDNIALARVRCTIGTRDFVDFLTLVRVDGTWRIIAKIFNIIEPQR